MARPRRPLSTRLVCLVLATLLPMLCFAAAAVLWSARQQREVTRERGMDTARALLSAVDRELLHTVGALEVLASSPTLDVPDLPAFESALARAVASRPAWLGVRLDAPDGRVLVRSARDTLPPAAVDRPSFERVLRTRQPAVGDLVGGPPEPGETAPGGRTGVGAVWRFGVRVPVVRQDQVVSVLTAALAPAAVEDVLGRLRMPADWTGSILDARHIHVAHTRTPERLLGHPAAPGLRTASEQASEGWVRPHALEDGTVYAAYSRSGWSGWTAALGIPAATVDAPLQHVLLGLGGVGIAATLAAIALAVVLGRRLAAPIAALADRAPAIVRGEPVDFSVSAPAEVATLVDAIAEAASERSRMEAELRRTDRLLKAVFETTPDAVYVKDLDSRYLLINSAGARLVGREPDEVIGKTDAELFSPDSARRLQLQDREIIEQGATATFENRDIETATGEMRTYLSTKMPYRDAEGRVAGVMAITRDISERRKAEEERTRALQRAESARIDAESANRSKDEFLAILSHELRTPLNAVYGWARMLRVTQLSPDVAARAVEVIERNAQAQLQLIEDLLDVSRVITGKMRLDVRPFDLATVIEAAVDSVRPAAAAKGIRVDIAVSPDAGSIVGDADRLQQVVWNLVSNAVKFTPQGGHVQVQLTRAPTRVDIVVSDTGQGIPADVLPYVFDRFRQADSTSTRLHGGLGLGLALVRHLVELHGGTVRAESEGQGRGARFSISLPIAPPAHGADGMAGVRYLERAMPIATGPLAHCRVLVVDRDADAVELVRVILESEGAELQTCAHALDALDRVRHWRPDLVLCDLDVPHDDGVRFLVALRALERDLGARFPAVALTAGNRVEDRARATAAGFRLHLAKPVDPGELVRLVGDLTAVRRGAA